MNTTALFTTSSFDPASAYQWQVDSSGSFVNLVNGGQYSGVNDDSLRINNLRTAQTGHRFRCILSNNPCSDTTAAATLTVVNTTSVEENALLNFRPTPIPPTNIGTLLPSQNHWKNLLCGRWAGQKNAGGSNHRRTLRA